MSQVNNNNNNKQSIFKNKKVRAAVLAILIALGSCFGYFGMSEGAYEKVVAYVSEIAFDFIDKQITEENQVQNVSVDNNDNTENNTEKNELTSESK